MERLTKRDKYGHWYTNERIFDRFPASEPYPHAFDGKPIDRLAHYEDLEEQGRLGELFETRDCSSCRFLTPRAGCMIHNTVPGGCKDFVSRFKREAAKPRFTPAEAETARQIMQMFPSARNARLGSSGQGLIIETDGLEPLIPRQDLFPSLRPGERVPLSKIAEGAG